jgi:hypothetical protein
MLQKYADSLAENTLHYGQALWYYALAHHPKKMRNVLDLLVSYCIVQSSSFPAEADLDDYLKRLITSPKSAISQLAETDYEAGRLLGKHFSGYATLRRFYDLRDAETQLKPGDKSKTSPQLRRKQAVTTLIAAIRSAADNIHGGLYDESRGSVISVDFVLALLCEASVFIDRKFPLSPSLPLHSMHLTNFP